MKSEWKMALYWRLPISVQEFALGVYAGRLDRLYYGAEFERWKEMVVHWKSRSWSDSRAWQFDRLRTILALASRSVPHYRTALQAIRPEEIVDEVSLRRIPLLSKQELRQNESRFLVNGFDRSHAFVDRTSGSTGTALTVYWPIPAIQRYWAVHEVTVRNAVGVDRLLPRAMMGGRPIVPGRQASPPYWRYNRRWGQLYMSSYHISSQTAPVYAEAIRSSGVVWLTGYGSAIGALARDALDAGLSPVPLRVVIVSGDTLQSGMRTAIEQFFQCRCYDHYGQAEGICWIFECDRGRLHVIPEFGIMEIVTPDGTPCPPGEVGEIVATGLLNDGMPLLRYRTGDSAAWAIDQQCSCGRNTPIIDRLEGRVDDYLVTADGRRIGRLSTAIKRSPTVHSAQIVQTAPGKGLLLIKPGSGYTRKDAEVICADIGDRIGSFELRVHEVEEIPRTPAGKLRLVVRLDHRDDLRELYSHLLTDAGVRSV
jgi:phenylacetate-CoA ligase